jgi:hypothetical protein
MKCSQVQECGNWEIEEYNSVLEIMRHAVSFLGIHKLEPCRHLYWILNGPSFAVKGIFSLFKKKITELAVRLYDKYDKYRKKVTGRQWKKAGKKAGWQGDMQAV